MRRLDLTLPTAAENLALDEALLNEVQQLGPTLRIWESPSPAVIVGRASRIADEVNQDWCDRESIPVLRRCSGGATVLISPGCLMYAVVIPTGQRPDLSIVENAHRFVLSHLQQALEHLRIEVTSAGSSDLTWQGRKFSGNSLRCKRDALLYHGTLLYAADIERIERCLSMPPRQPEYRRQRAHREFLTNLPTNRAPLTEALANAWQATAVLEHWPGTQAAALVAERYGRRAWNYQR